MGAGELKRELIPRHAGCAAYTVIDTSASTRLSHIDSFNASASTTAHAANVLSSSSPPSVETCLFRTVSGGSGRSVSPPNGSASHTTARHGGSNTNNASSPRHSKHSFKTYSSDPSLRRQMSGLGSVSSQNPHKGDTGSLNKKANLNSATRDEMLKEIEARMSAAVESVHNTQ